MAQGGDARLTRESTGRYALSGDLGFATVTTLWEKGGAVFRDCSGDTLELDLSGVRQGDSAGLALLVAWLSQASVFGCRLRYTAVPERLLAIARLSNVDSLIGG